MKLQRVILERLESTDQGTFGKIYVGGAICFFTGELPWRNNENNFSCIPPGVYSVNFTFSPTFKKFLYLVNNVPGRSGVRLHSANLMGDRRLGLKSQLNGCISLGEKLGHINSQKAVLLSVCAVRRFEEALGKRPFELEIVYG